MAIWLQHLVVLMLVGICAWVVVAQGVQTLRLRKGKVGSCCSRGCGASVERAGSQRVVFVPVEALKRKSN